MADAGEDIRGKVCLVTGATSGIGEVTARKLARRGATVVVSSRSRQKAEATVEEIRSRTGSENVEYLLTDFSSQQETRGLANEFKARHDRLDVLVNNAGAIFSDYGETEDGIERTFAVNHLSYSDAYPPTRRPKNPASKRAASPVDGRAKRAPKRLC